MGYELHDWPTIPGRGEFVGSLWRRREGIFRHYPELDAG
jgi:hypothetical protein